LIFRLVGVSAPKVLEIAALGGASFFAGVGLAWWFGIKKRGGTFADLGFTNVRPCFDFPIAFLSEIIVLVALAAYGYLLKAGGLKVPEQPVIELFGRTRSGFVLAAIVVAVLAPIGEEVFFRGFLYSGLKKRWGVTAGIVASAGIFAVFHITPLLYLPMFLIGATLAIVFEYRGSLAPNILLHALNNLVALLALYGR
jgi:membrane protease YdiL (CAAX protease family)